uniref:Reverse transcriptase domain-containing protein n=1 Tax=Lactuca sativa TaxID=4236 RepID=A0A9R1XVB2_LACSA|nr:hypothetical protein LSAT_V11C200090910 [Lactuca sativa]
MNIFSNNIRGIGCEIKRCRIRDSRIQNCSFFVGLQETKSTEVKGKLDRQIWGSTNFQCEVIHPVGLSGGIASLWDPSLFGVFCCSPFTESNHPSSSNNLRLEPHRDSTGGEGADGETDVEVWGMWLRVRKKVCFVNVYAPQEPTKKKIMWSKLYDLINPDSESYWFVFGDFNVVRMPEERLGSVFCHNSAFHFNNFIHSSGLLEVKMGGRRFTFMSKAGDKHSKLDRYLVTPNVFDSWPSLSVMALPRVHSDHCAILLSSNQLDFGPSPFKFFNSWMKEPGKLRNLKEHIKSWRKETIEKARREQVDLVSKINGIDLLAETGQISDDLLRDRQNAYQKIMENEARRIEDLKQKSRTKWAIEICDPAAIKEVVFNHFAGRFAEPNKLRPKFISPNFKKLPPQVAKHLEDPFSLDEIKATIWACGSDKAPGPDGFSFSFLKQHWEVIGGDFYLAVKHFEATRYIDKGCNSSFITLIPKVQDPITINDFRPISLIGCLYKTISKVLAKRLKKVVHLVVSETQTTYIKNRHILDGPLILNEIIRWIKKNKRKAFTFKVDFEKSFDSLSWGYLDSVMQQMQFGSKWRTWIQGCLSSTRVSVLLNGLATSEFCMERGVRQGDPLSPFLFIIAAEGLHIAMESAKENGVFDGIQLPRHGPVISHLQYADDVVFMGMWLPENLKNLIRILRCFELASGLKINMSKCKLPPGRRIYGKNNTLETNHRKISDETHKMESFHFVLWGRLTLCKAVLSSLGSFYFSIYKAPMKVINSLEQIRMTFVWGGSIETRKMAWIAWDKTLAAKDRGGLGIGSLKAQNIALLGKWWWRFKNFPDSNWAVVIKAIHGLDGGLARPSAAKRRSSCWGTIVNIQNSLDKDQVSFSNHFQQVSNEDGSQKWTWTLSPAGLFTVSSLRSHIDNITLPFSDGNWMWNPLVPGKLNILAWRAGKDRLPSMDNLFKYGINSSNLCKMCNAAPESADHIFVGCLVSKEVWLQIGGHQRLLRIHEAIMLVFMWVIWRYRNVKAHGPNAKSHTMLASEVQALSHLWINARKRRCQNLCWNEWCSDPVLECYRKL